MPLLLTHPRPVSVSTPPAALTDRDRAADADDGLDDGSVQLVEEAEEEEDQDAAEASDGPEDELDARDGGGATTAVAQSDAARPGGNQDAEEEETEDEDDAEDDAAEEEGDETSRATSPPSTGSSVAPAAEDQVDQLSPLRPPLNLLDLPDELIIQICRECREGRDVDSFPENKDARHLFPLSRANKRLYVVSAPTMWEYAPDDLRFSRPRDFRLSCDPTLWALIHFLSVNLIGPSTSLPLPMITPNLVDLTLNFTSLEDPEQPAPPPGPPAVFSWTLTNIIRSLSHLRALAVYADSPQLMPTEFEDTSFSFAGSIPNVDTYCLRYAPLGLPRSTNDLKYLSATYLSPSDFADVICYGIERVAALHTTVSLPSGDIPADVVSRIQDFVTDLQADSSRTFRLRRFLLHAFHATGSDDSIPVSLLNPLLRALAPVGIEFIDLTHGSTLHVLPDPSLLLPSVKTLVLDRDDCSFDFTSTSLLSLSHLLPSLPSLTRLTLKGWTPTSTAPVLAAPQTLLDLALAQPVLFALLTLLEKTTSVEYLRMRREYSDGPSREKTESLHFFRNWEAKEGDKWRWEVFYPA